MFRNLSAMLVILALCSAGIEAQPGFWRVAGVSGGPPGGPPGSGLTPRDVQGRWFMGGDSLKPCSVEVFGAPYGGPRLVFTNARGQRTTGRFDRGNRVIAFGWGDGGVGDLGGTVRGDLILWTNGTYWMR